jgi:hypothetical protein
LPSRPQPSPSFLPLALLIGLAGAAALSLTTSDAGLALTIPALALGAMATWRWPAAAVVLTFLLTGTVNVLATMTPISVVDVTDYLLASLWLGVLGGYLLGRGARRTWLWPALLAAVLYLALTALQILATDPVSLGVLSFRTAAWYMAAMALVALAPWSTRTHARIAKGVVLVALAVGAYSVFRWLTGAADDETAAARAAMPGVPLLGLRFFGSFLSAFQLAAWTASVIPFCLAALLGWRSGPWRLAALAAIAFMTLALLASEVRTGLIAASIGVAITLGLFVLAPTFRRQRGIAIVAVAAIAVLGGGAFSVTVAGDPERLDRYMRIFTPGQDTAYAKRLERWGVAMDEIGERPWGHGLGSVGYAARFNERGAVGPPILDSAYLKVGLEQGFAVMALYFLALLILLLGLARRALLMRDRQRTMLAIGGAGALGAQMVMFYTGNYSEGTVVAGAWLLVGLGVAQVTVREEGRGQKPQPRVGA